MKKLLVGIVAALLVFACSSCIIVTNDSGTVALYNDRSYTIDMIDLCDADTDETILSTDMDLLRGETYRFYDVPNGRYYLSVRTTSNAGYFSRDFDVDGNTRTTYFSEMNYTRK